MIPTSLFAKITMAVAGLFIVLAALLVAFIDNSAHALQQETAQKLNINLAANLAKESPLWVDQGLAAKPVEAALHTLMVLGPALELYILAPDGELLNYSDPDGKVVRTRIDMTPIQQFLRDSTMLPILGDDPRSLHDRKIFSVAPIQASPSTTGSVVGSLREAATPPVAYLYIIIGGQLHDSVSAMLDTSHFARLGIGTIVVGALLSAAVLLLLFFHLTTPLRRLSAGLTEFRDTRFLEVPASLQPRQSRGNNELDQLAAGISDMAQRIVSQLQQLMKGQQLRQELVTHISHDLRTPLASIRGYLEGWQLANGQTDAEEARRCAEIALRNCAQLERMVDELFELSRLEANEVRAVPELFPLDELVDDILQEMAPKAAVKSLQLRCQSPEKLPLVNADIGQINRVFTNLLDNAIRHSNHGGQVIIDLAGSVEQNRVRVKVIDSGSGIPPQDIAQLFEPYFRASNQDKHYPQGTGLGLAITKRLLALNGTNIDVKSQLNVGSVFRFFLPMVPAIDQAHTAKSAE